VASIEGFQIDAEQASRLIESSGNDIRQVINIMQMWSQKSRMGAHQGTDFSATVCKDDKVMINNFDAAHRLLNHGAVSLDLKYASFRDKVDLFFVDHEWVPLLVQEGYLGSMDKRCSLEDVETMADAADFISLGDSLNKQLRTNQDWSLLPNIAVCSSVAPALLVKGRSFFPGFP
jgi:replication factor C subunit 1